VGVLKSVTFTELCSFDSESSEKKILLIEYVFILLLFCGLVTLLMVGCVYPPLNMDHSSDVPHSTACESILIKILSVAKHLFTHFRLRLRT
jgi:hypothetical protein